MKDEKVKIILKAGRDLFARYGMRKTTVDEIAKKAGIAKGTIYIYYKNKEDVFKAVFFEEIDKIMKEVRSAVDAASEAEAKFRSYIITRMRCIHKLATFYEPFMEDYLENYAFLENIRKDYNDNEINILKSILKLGVSTGEFAVKNMEFAAFSIVMALKGMEYYWVREKDEKLILDRIDGMMDIIFNGLKKR